MATNNIEVKGVVQTKGNKLYIVLSWYEDGKRKQKWIATGLEEKGNKRKAQSMIPGMAERVAKEVEARSDPDNPECAYFTQFFMTWLELTKHSLAPSTYTEYKRIANKNILPFFEPKKLFLTDVKPLHIQNYYNQLIETRHLSPTSVRRHHAIIHKFFSYCVKIGYLLFNPASRVELPKKKKFVGSYLTADQLKILLAAVEGTKMETPVKLAAWYGMRRGEIAGLKWKYIDFERNQFEIRGVITDRGDKSQTENLQYLDETKTASSQRTLPLFPEAKAYLLRLKEWQEYNKKMCGRNYNTKWEEFVCVDTQGNLIQPEYISWTFPKILERCELPRVRFHDLRHTNATLLLAAGANMKDVQCWLGHSNYSTTADIYGHVLESNQKALGTTIALLTNF